MKIYVINGPNLNMLGIREPDFYGHESYENLLKIIDEHAKWLEIECVCYQSNHEGDLVDKIQEAYFEGADGIVINPGAYTHTSIALLDAVKANYALKSLITEHNSDLFSPHHQAVLHTSSYTIRESYSWTQF